MRYSNIQYDEDGEDYDEPTWWRNLRGIATIPSDTVEAIARDASQHIWLIANAVLAGPEYILDSLVFRVSPVTDPLLIPLDPLDSRAEVIVGSMSDISAGRRYLTFSTDDESYERSFAAPRLTNYPLESLKTNTGGRFVTVGPETIVSTLAGVVI